MSPLDTYWNIVPRLCCREPLNRLLSRSNDLLQARLFPPRRKTPSLSC